MQPKSNLNNTQRKMLDEIYVEQFKTKERLILQKREDGLRQLKEKVLRKEKQDKNIKVILQTAEKLAILVKQHKDSIIERGMNIKGLSFDKTDVYLELSSGYYNNYQKHPEIQAYEDETDNIRLELAQKKKEIRARIYGLTTTYEEADKEISEVLKTVKV